MNEVNNGLQEGQKEINPEINVKPKRNRTPAKTRRRLFVAHYLATKNITESAKAAGYSPKSAYAIGNSLLKDPRVKEEIDRELKRIIEGSRVRAEDIRLTWKSIMEDQNANHSDRLRASELLAKELGLFKESEKPQVAIFQAFTDKDFKQLEGHKDIQHIVFDQTTPPQGSNDTTTSP